MQFLQIDRIAMCWLKLSHLYEVEAVRLALVNRELDLHPERILEKIPEEVGVTKAMALEIIKDQKITPLFDLTLELLAPIVAKTRFFIGIVSSAREFKKTFPLPS